MAIKTRFLAACASVATVATVAALPDSVGRRVTANLVVSTDPSGANVFINGKYAGQTPMEMSGLPAGKYRVRLVKSGYLENARVIDLERGNPSGVRVKLTPDGSVRSTSAQVMSGGQGGGLLSNKWLWIGAAAAGGTAAYALRDKNAAPSVDAVGVEPAIGLQGATVINFAAVGARDPDNDPLTYTWDFGDGATGSGSTTTHQYAAAGIFTATVKVSDGKHTASATGSVNIVSLSGTWRGQNANYSLTITQAGTALNIVWDDVAFGLNRRWTGPGSVASPKNMTATLTAVLNTSGQLSINGTLDSSGNVLTGTVTGFAAPFNLDVRRQ